MSARYASATAVKSEASRHEIERTLIRYGASVFSYGWQEDKAAISFIADDRQIRFVLPMPDRASKEFTRTPTGKARIASAVEREYEQAVRQRWRALALMVKAKLEAVAAGIVTFEEEFLPHIVLPSGHTVYEDIRDEIATTYLNSSHQRLMIGSGS